MEETKELLRESGIDVLGRVPWGIHACLFYKTKEDLVSMLVPYFKAGLENNEFCMWITSEPLGRKQAESAMTKAVPDFGRYVSAGQIEILSHRQWYLKNGGFDGRRVLKGWLDKLEKALNTGYAGMRLTGNTTWIGGKRWKDFNRYEKQVNLTIERYDMIALCTYCLDGCSPAEIIDAANTHQLVIIEKQRQWELMKNAERKRTHQRAREYQAELKSLASQLTLAEERERRRIASEIHDVTIQSLALAKMKLDGLSHSVSLRDPAEVLDEVRGALGKAIDETRSLVSRVHSPILALLGFEAAVGEWLTGQIQEKHGIECRFEDDGQPKPLDDDVQLILFRDVRELLMNVVKHARAKKVKVFIRTDGEQICIGVEDDGIGFDSAEAATAVHKRDEFGLFSIRERLKELGGAFEIESAPGRGCRAVMRAPLSCGTQIGGNT